MRQLDFLQYNKDNICIALGFFDSVHVVHREILTKVLSFCKKNEYKSCVMTFINNPDDLLDKGNKLIYTYDERFKIFENLNFDYVLPIKFDEKFKNIDKITFLTTLFKNFNVKMFACGYDYRFGKNGEGDIFFLKEFCLNNGIELEVVEKKDYCNDKISSTLIKKLLSNGELTLANNLLVDNYHIQGKVIKGRGVGHVHGFPTANIIISKDKLHLKEGVYGTILYIDGCDDFYYAVTNYGNKPSFNDDSFTIESYIENFNDDIYGKNIKLEFIKYIRGIKKFNSPIELKAQIERDKNWRHND